MNEIKNNKTQTSTIKPGETIELWHKDTPIIPEVGYNTHINNVGDTSIKAIYQWKPPLGSHWKEVKDQTFLPGEDGVFHYNGQSFYHQRVVVQNLSNSVSAKLEWNIIHYATVGD
ncbi:hypothetical protein AB8613_20985 [Vibrio sp. BS-M-Sm-2]|uniref:hypothetical protein n=1 Tax=Vibrio sp. BS-M-Sm-2 TaxID=3241167 RepID=UPI003555CACC